MRYSFPHAGRGKPIVRVGAGSFRRDAVSRPVDPLASDEACRCLDPLGLTGQAGFKAVAEDAAGAIAAHLADGAVES